MQRFRVGADVALTPSDEVLSEVTISPLVPSIASGSPVQVAIFRIGANGGIWRHPATVPQILAVLSGSGEVAGGDAPDSNPSLKAMRCIGSPEKNMRPGARKA